MRKKLVCIASVIAILSMAACGNAGQPDPATENTLASSPAAEVQTETNAESEEQVKPEEASEAPAADLSKEQPKEPAEKEPAPKELKTADPKSFVVRDMDVTIDDHWVESVIFNSENDPGVQLLEYPSEVDGKPVTIIGGFGAVMTSMASGNCKDVLKIVVPEGVTRIDAGTAPLCSQLETVELPDSLTYIAAGAFISCPRLKELHIPDGVTTIEEGAFENCQSLVVTYQGEQFSMENDPNGWWTDARQQ